jgi:hypothetical protein
MGQHHPADHVTDGIHPIQTGFKAVIDFDKSAAGG